MLVLPFSLKWKFRYGHSWVTNSQFHLVMRSSIFMQLANLLFALSCKLSQMGAESGRKSKVREKGNLNLSSPLLLTAVPDCVTRSSGSKETGNFFLDQQGHIVFAWLPSGFGRYFKTNLEVGSLEPSLLVFSQRQFSLLPEKASLFHLVISQPSKDTSSSPCLGLFTS